MNKYKFIIIFLSITISLYFIKIYYDNSKKYTLQTFKVNFGNRVSIFSDSSLQRKFILPLEASRSSKYSYYYRVTYNKNNQIIKKEYINKKDKHRGYSIVYSYKNKKIATVTHLDYLYRIRYYNLYEGHHIIRTEYTYYPTKNNNIKQICRYLDGKLHGVTIVYNQKGKIIEKKHYKHNVLNSIYIYEYLDNSGYIESLYIKDKLVYKKHFSN